MGLAAAPLGGGVCGAAAFLAFGSGFADATCASFPGGIFAAAFPGSGFAAATCAAFPGGGFAAATCAGFAAAA